ncbi:GNAT family N-acetyltransferase [Actinokineospora sp.]|uniref:GNAT family N-acetyltransferase n=1 Tax=Actinokineospora sp. TaxID=1872133 RepID=UPI0040380ABF
MATDADLASVAALRRRWTEEDQGSPITDPDFDTAFARWWAAERSRRQFWLAELDVPVGFLNVVEFARMPRPGLPPSHWAYISNVYVVPEHRDSGLGAQLLAAAVQHADNHGYVRLVLSPTERSVPFYRRAGFGPATDLLLRTPTG